MFNFDLRALSSYAAAAAVALLSTSMLVAAAATPTVNAVAATIA